MYNSFSPLLNYLLSFLSFHWQDNFGAFSSSLRITLLTQFDIVSNYEIIRLMFTLDCLAQSHAWIFMCSSSGNIILEWRVKTNFFPFFKKNWYVTNSQRLTVYENLYARLYLQLLPNTAAFHPFKMETHQVK